MAWYRTGNVAVAASDTVVTGTGTLFATHVRVGDGFVGPDGRMYEVTNVASETVLSIFPPYLGATASGQDYSIIPVQGYPKQLSDRAGVLVGQVGQLPGRIDDIDDVLAALGSAAGANMPTGVTEFGTAAGAQLTELLTKAGNLAGLDDTAQSRLNLGVIQTLAGEVFNSDNCAVIENANGTAWRFRNGLQVCVRGNFGFTHRTSALTGTIFATGDLFWTYPAAFISQPAFAAYPILGAAAVWGWAILGEAGSGSNTAATFRMAGHTSQSSAGTATLVSAGKWRSA